MLRVWGLSLRISSRAAGTERSFVWRRSFGDIERRAVTVCYE